MKIVLPCETATFVDLDVLQTAQRAFAAHQNGVLTGNWIDFLSLMSDDIEFQAPSPYLPNGSIRGKHNVAEILHKVTQELQLAARLTLLHPIVASETTVAFEFLAEGKVADQPLLNKLVVFYEIENCKIRSIREYTAQPHPKTFDQIKG